MAAGAASAEGGSRKLGLHVLPARTMWVLPDKILNNEGLECVSQSKVGIASPRTRRRNADSSS